MVIKSLIINFDLLVSNEAKQITATLLSKIKFPESIKGKNLNKRIKFLEILIENIKVNGNQLQVPFNSEYYHSMIGFTKVTTSTVVKSVCSLLKDSGYVDISPGYHHSDENRSFTVVTANKKLLELINSASSTNT